MSWEINISSEGWEEIYNKLYDMSKIELLGAIETDMYLKMNYFHNINEIAYHQQIKIYHKLMILHKYASIDTLVETCFDLIKENNTCDNGGNAFWIDTGGFYKVYLN